ncbi:hypothetical protein LJB94_02305 [Odoribacter sp. OttesenSCG-928-G04]|nr:hypothetical protein [Odoribacter sp. OttesenSCG-928-G04]
MKLKTYLKIVLGGTFLLSTTLFTACDRNQKVEDEIVLSDQEEDADEAESVFTDFFPIAQSNIVVKNNNTSLSRRVVYHTPVAQASLNTRSEVSSFTDIPSEALADGFSSVATILPMEDEAHNILSSTCVQYFGNYAVISYHLHGEGTGGGLELVDISDPLNPQSISQIYIHNRDFNHIVFENESNIENSKFWALADDPKKGTCYLVEGSLSDADFTTSLSEVRLLGSSANNAVRMGDKLLIATSAPKAKTGYFQTYDIPTKTISKKDESTPSQRAKHISVENNSLVTFSLENCTNENVMAWSATGSAILRYYENFESFATPTAEYNLGDIKPIDGKNVVILKDGIAYIALGKSGFKAVNVSDGTVVGSYLNDKGIANGVGMDATNVYVAYGSGGIFVLDAQSLSHKYTLFPGYESSSNYIAMKEEANLLMIANGVSGTRFLSTDAELEPACTSYVDLVKGTKAIYKGHSSVFNSDHPTMQEVFADGDAVPNYYEITEPTSLFVTYTGSTASNSNVLGYFVTPAGEDIKTYYETVVRPQFKKDQPVNMDFVLFRSLNKNNTLYTRGDYMTINNLKPGEKVVFFIIQWIGRDTDPIIFTGSSGILTTIKELNFYDGRYFKSGEYGDGVEESWKAPDSFKKRFHGNFYSEECNAIVTTFEDITSTSCDNDYTDVVFGVSDNLYGLAPSKFKMDKPIVHVDSEGFIVERYED